jgi:hypothetical protein
MADEQWRRGEVIVRREVWRGRAWLGSPVYVVADEPTLLALYLPEGAPFGFPKGEWPGGLHPWHGRASWEGHGVLMLQRPTDAYAVWVFWTGPDRHFAAWYVNLQDPFRRSQHGIDTLDHEIDLVSTDGEHWEVKDADLLNKRVAEGRFKPAEAAAIRLALNELLAQLATGGRWWNDEWASWAPDPSWSTPELPDGWHL